MRARGPLPSGSTVLKSLLLVHVVAVNDVLHDALHINEIVSFPSVPLLYDQSYPSAAFTQACRS